jgi:hypothetical protein
MVQLGGNHNHSCKGLINLDIFRCAGALLYRRFVSMQALMGPLRRYRAIVSTFKFAALYVIRPAILTPRIASSADVTLMAPLPMTIRCRLIGRARWLSLRRARSSQGQRSRRLAQGRASTVEINRIPGCPRTTSRAENPDLNFRLRLFQASAGYFF